MSRHNTTEHHEEKLDDVHGAHTGGRGPTCAPNTHGTTQSPRKKSTAAATTDALLKTSGHAKGTITPKGCQTSPGNDGRNRYWLGANVRYYSRHFTVFKSLPIS